MALPPIAWALALLVGALASALAAGAFWGLGLPGRRTGLAIAVGHAVLLGLPAALYFRRRRWTHVLAAIAGGFVIGAVPIGLYLAGATLVDGKPTVADLLTCLRIAGIGGAFGAPGGLAFWLTLRAFGLFR